MTLTTAEALGTYFQLVINGETVKIKGLHMPDSQLEKYSKVDKGPLLPLAPVARQLLAETVATSDQDESGKPRTVRVPAPPPESPEDDGMGPSGVWEAEAALEQQASPPGPTLPVGRAVPATGVVTSPTSHPPVAVKAAVPHATKPTPEDMPGWARELFAEVRRANENAARAADSAITIMEKMTTIATTLKTWASESKPTAPGIGQGGGAGQESDGVFSTETIEAKKEKGKLSFKVKGGGFKKFGVLVWPEVLEAAGLRPDSFPIGDEVPFAGYSAHYILGDPNEAGKQFPRKITRLVRH